MFTLNEFAETSRSQMPSWYGSVLTVVGFLVTFVASLSLLGSGAYYVPALTIASAGSAMMVAGVATLLISLVFEDHRDNNEQIEEWQVNEWLEQYKAATNDSRVVVEYSMDCLRNQ
jgi:peptidoglycan/LPS O-acetylase OafA/YrhL